MMQSSRFKFIDTPDLPEIPDLRYITDYHDSFLKFAKSVRFFDDKEQKYISFVRNTYSQNVLRMANSRGSLENFTKNFCSNLPVFMNDEGTSNIHTELVRVRLPGYMQDLCVSLGIPVPCGRWRLEELIDNSFGQQRSIDDFFISGLIKNGK